MILCLWITIIIFAINCFILEARIRLYIKEYSLLLEKYQLNKIQWETALKECNLLKKELEDLKGEK